MGAIVMNGAKVGANCVVAAGALVSEGKELPAGSLVMGMPARVKRTLSDEEIAHLCTAAGDEYLAVGARMLEEGLLDNPEPGTTWTCIRAAKGKTVSVSLAGYRAARSRSA